MEEKAPDIFQGLHGLSGWYCLGFRSVRSGWLRDRGSGYFLSGYGTLNRAGKFLFRRSRSGWSQGFRRLFIRQGDRSGVRNGRRFCGVFRNGRLFGQCVDLGVHIGRLRILRRIGFRLNGRTILRCRERGGRMFRKAGQRRRKQQSQNSEHQ